jgi:SpoVK/Ycf46/Vps4 family AAA+-type ATPase
MEDSPTFYDEIEEEKISTQNKEKVKRTIKKVLTTTRAAIEVYFAIRRRDPIYVALSLTSAYEALDAIFTREPEEVETRLKKMGLIKILKGTERMVMYILNDLQVPGRTILTKKEEHHLNKVYLYDISGCKIYAVIDDGNVSSIYSKNEEDFIAVFSILLKDNLGEFISIDTVTENWTSYLKVNSIEVPLETYLSTINEKEFYKTIVKFRKMELNRSTLLFGDPGSGKTTFAAKIARMLNGRLVVISAQTLDKFTNTGFNNSLQQIFKFLSPSVVLFDDIDRLSEYELGLLLGTLESLNRYKNSEIIIMASVNDLTKLPDAMKRPGRFDEIIVFSAPDYEQRKEIIKIYLKFFGTRLANKFVDEMAELTEGLTPAYLREVALQASVASYDRIPGVIKNMKIMLYMNDDEEDEDDFELVDDMPTEIKRRVR